MGSMTRRALGLATVAWAVFGAAAPAVAELPRDYQAFKARYQREATTPEGALKLYFEAVFSYMDESRRDEAGKMLRYAMHWERPIERSPVLATFVSRLKDPRQHYIFRSFARGSSPENDYQMSPDDFELMVAGQRQEADRLNVLLRSSGADSPRIVWVKQFEDGLWYTINNAGTYAQVRQPLGQSASRRNAHDADYD